MFTKDQPEPPPQLQPVRAPILEQFVREVPSPQNAVNLFAGEWWSRFPGRWYPLTAGHLSLFLDARIDWAIAALGGVAGKSLLELGPLEGGHTYSLEQAGAESVLAIEGNTRAFLKCLIAKEIVGMPRSHFLLGDFEEYLRADPGKFDAVVACGVLYHLRDPVELIHNLARATDTVYIWTLYYDRAQLDKLPHMTQRFAEGHEATHHGFRHTLYHYNYKDFLDTPRYAGGTEEFSHWLSLEDLLGAVRHAGFTEIQIGDHDPGHANGPCIGFVARRPPSPAKRRLWPFG